MYNVKAAKINMYDKQVKDWQNTFMERHAEGIIVQNVEV